LEQESHDGAPKHDPEHFISMIGSGLQIRIDLIESVSPSSFNPWSAEWSGTIKVVRVWFLWNMCMCAGACAPTTASQKRTLPGSI
jgi:hypothetical protein